MGSGDLATDRGPRRRVECRWRQLRRARARTALPRPRHTPHGPQVRLAPPPRPRRLPHRASRMAALVPDAGGAAARPDRHLATARGPASRDRWAAASLSPGPRGPSHRDARRESRGAPGDTPAGPPRDCRGVRRVAAVPGRVRLDPAAARAADLGPRAEPTRPPRRPGRRGPRRPVGRLPEDGGSLAPHADRTLAVDAAPRHPWPAARAHRGAAPGCRGQADPLDAGRLHGWWSHPTRQSGPPLSRMLEALLWTVFGWFGLSSTACGFWAALNTAALEADPDIVLHTAEQSLAEQLEVTAAAAETAIWIDRLGASGLRALTGFPPTPFPQAVAIVDHAQADVAEGLRLAVSRAAMLPRRTRSARDTTLPASRLSRIVQEAVGSLATSAREAFAPGQAPKLARAEEVPPAATVVAHLAAAHAAVATAHVEVRRLLFRTTIWSLVQLSGAAVALTILGSTIVALRRPTPAVPPPTSLPPAPRWRGAPALPPAKADPALVGGL